jgi:protocatechuate 4,5-dioxygenase alpha chain
LVTGGGFVVDNAWFGVLSPGGILHAPAADGALQKFRLTWYDASNLWGRQKMNVAASGGYVFTGEDSARSYRLNKMAMTLTAPENRARFKADEDGYMRGLGLSEQEIDLVRQRDWKGMMDYGASIYLVIKIGGSVGHSLPEIGAHTAGMTVAEFQAARGH